MTSYGLTKMTPGGINRETLPNIIIIVIIVLNVESTWQLLSVDIDYLDRYICMLCVVFQIGFPLILCFLLHPEKLFSP